MSFFFSQQDFLDREIRVLSFDTMSSLPCKKRLSFYPIPLPVAPFNLLHPHCRLPTVVFRNEVAPLKALT